MEPTCTNCTYRDFSTALVLAYVFIPLLVAEIAEDNVRGTLGTIITVSCNFGILLSFIAGNVLTYYFLPFYLITIPVVFFLLFVWFPESPIYLMTNNEPKKAGNALRIYRNCRRDSQVGLGTYMYLNQLGWDLLAISWVPVITFSSLVFNASCGVIPISFVIMTEIMPTKIRSVATSICLCYSWLLAFVLLKFFPIISEAIGLYVCIAFFAVCSFGGTLFVIFVMPETKGKSFHKIQLKLERK